MTSISWALNSFLNYYNFGITIIEIKHAITRHQKQAAMMLIIPSSPFSNEPPISSKNMPWQRFIFIKKLKYLFRGHHWILIRFVSWYAS